MGCTVTFHHRISQDRLNGAIEPLSSAAFHGLLESAVGEAMHASLGAEEVEVELTLSGDEEMTHLNFDHMGERGPTDVLAFPLHEWSLDGGHSHLADEETVVPPGGLLLGDVVVDVDQAVRQAADGGWSPVQEITLLAVHGALHLVGHDHAESDDELTMRSAEHHVLTTLRRRHAEVGWKPGSLFDRPSRAVSTPA
jgi:probable rRNA maturation factor